MAMRSRFLEESMQEDIFAELEDFATATCDEIPTISAGKKAERERVMRKWNQYAFRCPSCTSLYSPS
jgi:hypothetical protein